MMVSDILAKKGSEVATIDFSEKVSNAIRLLHDKHIGALIVTDNEQNIAGIITERDILHMYAEKSSAAENMYVKDIMTPSDKLIVGDENNDLEYVMTVMSENRIRHLPIIRERGKIAGIISIGDVIKALLKNAEHERKMLSDYIEGKYPA